MHKFIISLDFPIVSYMMKLMNAAKILPKFDAFLNSEGLQFEAVVIGASALTLLGIISRETVDCDVLTPNIPPEISKAAKDFLLTPEAQESRLLDGWLNNGPSSLLKNLPSDWNTRTQIVFEGKSLKLHTLGRIDLLKTKLFAYCDRARDLEDCIAMKPTNLELDQAIAWVKNQDANPNWPTHVEGMFQALKKALGYGI
jgi:hypothetical protein